MGQLNVFRRLVLCLRNLIYAWKGQQESPACRFWVTNGQPRPDAYVLIRELYDSLHFAYQPGARLFSWAGRHNYVLMFPPDIPEPYTGKIDFGGFLVVTNARYYTDALCKRLKGGLCLRQGKKYIVGANRFASLADYLAFLDVLVSVERDFYQSHQSPVKTLAALALLCAAQQQDRGTGQAAGEPASSPEDRLAIDVDLLNPTIRRRDTWL